MTKYFNVVYFGRGAFGIEAAAQAYFGISARELSVPQAAALIALLQNPGKYEGSSTNDDTDRQARIDLFLERNEVLGAMAAQGFLTEEDVLEFQKSNLGVQPYTSFGKTVDLSGAQAVGAEFAAFQIVNDTRALLQNAGFSGADFYSIQAINTTISRTDQQAASKAYGLHTAQLPENNGVFGLVLVDETGGIKAYLPGEYSSEGPNIDLLRSPIVGGSQDKPYFAASVMLTFDTNSNRITPDYIVGDPAYFEWLNYDGNGSNYTPSEAANRCPEETCTLRESIARSANWGILGLVKELEQQGTPALQTGFDIMNEFGLDCLQPVGPAGVVGACELTPVQRALGAIQINGLQGKAIPAQNRGRFVNSYRLDDGRDVPVYDSGLAYQQVIPQEVAADVSTILEDAVTYGTAKALHGVSQKTYVVAKTGTPENNVAPGVNGYFMIGDKQYGFAVILRDPNDGSRSLGGDADGGKAPTRLAASVIENLLSSN